MATLELATVKYQVGTYSGTVSVNCFADHSDEYVLSKAKARLRQQAGGSLPYGYQHFEIVDRRTV